MKKLLIFFAAAAVLMSSCTQEKFNAPADGQEVNAAFTVRIPDNIATKAEYSDGTKATQLTYAVYESNSKSPLFNNVVTITNCVAEITDLVLITGKTYDLLFWAQSPDNKAYTLSLTEQVMKVNYDNMLANDDNNDAFFAFETLTVDGAINRTINLYRPFAQVNLGTNDIKASQDQSFILGRTSMMATAADVLNLADGTVSGKAFVPYAANAVPSKETETFPVPGYDTYLAMNYLLVGSDQTTTSCEFAVYEEGKETATNTITVSNVPVRRNYRTNIYGSLLTDPASLRIEIVPAFEKDDENLEITEVLGIDDVDEAIRDGAENIKVSEAPKGDGNVILPPVASENVGKEITISLPATGYEITFSYETDTPEAGKGNVENVRINAQGTENIIIDLPQSHVTLNGQDYGTVTATVSPTTLVVAEGTSVETLHIKGGNAEIYGTVGAVVLDKGTAVKAWTINTAADAVNAASCKAEKLLVGNVDALKVLASVTNESEKGFFKGLNIVLTDDIDLAGEEWTPIGRSGKTFQGTFDGNGKTISNLKISGNKSNVGLFGFTAEGEVKNLTVNNAEVSGYLNVGVVAGSPYTSKYTNVKVTGFVTVDGYSYVGGVGGKNVYAPWTDVLVDVEEGSYVNAQSENYRTYVGGVAGFVAEGKKTLTNIKSNIDVIGSTCDVGGLFGIAHYGTSYVNCSCSGDVSITAASDEGDDEEIGGIAGVWMNSASGDVTFTGCTFTGTLATNLGADLSDNTIVGGKYNRNSTDGKLIIDGITYLDGVEIDETGTTFTVSDANGLDWIAGQVAEGKNFDNQTVVIKDDINLPEGETWTPIGTNDTPFAGTIEGNNKAISGVEVSAGSQYAGFVGKLDYGAVIRDVILKDIVITSDSNMAGAIAGYNQGYIINCHIDGGTITSDQSNAGGITGINAGTGGAVIAGCSVRNLKINGKEGVSKLGGAISATNTTGAVIIGCCAENVTLNGFESAGGIVALNSTGYGRKIGKIIASYSAGCKVGDAGFSGTQNLYLMNASGHYGSPIVNTCVYKEAGAFHMVDAQGDAMTDTAAASWADAQAAMNSAIASWNAANSNFCMYQWGDVEGSLVVIQ